MVFNLYFLDKFICPLQGSFISKRGIVDTAIIVQDIVHHMHRKKGKKWCLLFNIDFEKSNDLMDWQFLENTLEDFGFPT